MQKIIKGSIELAKAIKHRRTELNLTIEAAASKAGVGTKTWSRYESGESIRKDKYKGVCKALNWRCLPDEQKKDSNDKSILDEYRNHEAWSKYLEETFGESAALSFAIGSDLILDHLNEDMQALSTLPRDTHIGEIGHSWLVDLLPRQFLMKYDYEFLYMMQDVVNQYRNRAAMGYEIIAHSVMEELALYIIVEESRLLMEDFELDSLNDEEAYSNWDEWIFDIFDDDDVIIFLYSGMYIDRDHTYHFEHWMERQFYC